jgi:integrase/recombinase XerD
MSSIYKPKIKDKTGNKKECKFYFISYYFQGKKCQMSLQVDTHKAAMTKQKNIDKLIAEGTDPKSVYKPDKKCIQSSMPRTVGQLVDEFLRNVEVVRNTKKGLQVYLKAALINSENKRPGIIHSDMPIEKITPDFVRNKFFAYIKEQYKPNTRNVIASYFRWMFNYALDSGYIEDNPFTNRGTKKLFPKTEDVDIHFYSKDEIGRMRDYLKKLSLEWRWFSDFILIDLQTGLRKQEMIDLTWNESIDFVGREIRVIKGKGGKYRTVPLNDEVLGILRARKAGYDKQKIKPLHNNVFPEMVFAEKPNRALKTMKDKLKIEHGTIHSFRHTYATNYLINGGNVAVLQKILGHSKIDTTMRYVHITNKDLHRDINRLTQYA